MKAIRRLLIRTLIHFSSVSLHLLVVGLQSTADGSFIRICAFQHFILRKSTRWSPHTLSCVKSFLSDFLGHLSLSLAYWRWLHPMPHLYRPGQAVHHYSFTFAARYFPVTVIQMLGKCKWSTHLLNCVLTYKRCSPIPSSPFCWRKCGIGRFAIFNNGLEGNNLGIMGQ